MFERMTRAIRFFLATTLATTGCRDELATYEDQGPRYEARAWITANANPNAFARNRFDSKEAARAFLDSLYASGADTVYVLNVQQDSAWIQREGGPYADALLVRLPSDAAARARLFEFGARETRSEGFEQERDRGQRYLYFWWD